MATETIILLENNIHTGAPLGAGGLTATSTANGYNKDSFRDPNLFTGWKPNDSSIDEYLQVETVNPMVAAAVNYMAIAWDPRAITDVGKRGFVQLSASTTSGGAYTLLASFSMNPGNTNNKISVGIVRIASAAAAYKFFRFVSVYNSGAGGVQQNPVFLHGCVVVTASTCVDSTAAQPEAMGIGSLGYVANSGILRSASGAYLSNRIAMPQQEIPYNARSATDVLLTKLIDNIQKYGDNTRCFFTRLDGTLMFNSANPGDGVVRIDADRWDAERFLMDHTDVTIPFVTEPYSLP